ncbi:DUF4235 domain-containing protein [Alloscardovia criceti]|uniref:DUF4235 domain-containing protein n=1 Tax=Alloscardovia criceti TaxID=356828 RepID=UPI0003633EF8|nr:DUF4235 domain-containing protein [Alloscardovia criceti]
MSENTDYSNLKTEEAVENLHKADEKINAIRTRIKNDPDDAFDKLLKLALPALAGLIGGKIAEILWKQGKRSVLGAKAIDDDGNDISDGIFASMIFAGLSAALGSLISSLSTKGSQGLVNLRHNRNARKTTQSKGRHKN